MKLAVYSESRADEKAVRVLAGALLGGACEEAPLTRLRARGWTPMLSTARVVICQLHYATDTDGLVIVADGNGSAVHAAAPGAECEPASGCRLCQLRAAVGRAYAELVPVPGRAPLRVAVGVAYPSVEAWYLCGRQQSSSEATWMRAMREGTQARGYILKLKQAVYGTDRPTLAKEVECAAREAQRLASDLAALEQAFPAGFGSLADEVRSWGTGNLQGE
jgi:hypothetical protein